jgi:hypothetical protein
MHRQGTTNQVPAKQQQNVPVGTAASILAAKQKRHFFAE